MKLFVKSSKVRYDWHLIRINNYLGKNIIKDGWGAYFGKSAYIGLFRNGIKQNGADKGCTQKYF